MVTYKKSLLLASLLASCGIVQSMSMSKTRDKEDQDQKALIARYQQAHIPQDLSLLPAQSRSRSYTSIPKEEVAYSQVTATAIQQAVAQKIEAQEAVKQHNEVKTEQTAPQNQNTANPLRNNDADSAPGSWHDEIDDAQRNIRNAQSRLEKSVKLKHSIEKSLSANDTTATEHLHELLQQTAPASVQRVRTYEKDIGDALVLQYELQLAKSETSALQKHLPQDVDCWSVNDIDQLGQQLHSVQNQERAAQLDTALLITDHQIKKEKSSLLRTEIGKKYAKDFNKVSSEALNQAIQDGIPFLKGTHDQLQNYRNENQQIRGKLYSKMNRIKFFFGYGKEEKKELQDALRDSNEKLNAHENYFKELLKEKLILEQLHEDTQKREETEGGNGPGGGGSPRGPRPQLSDEAYRIGNNNIIGKAVALGIAGYVLYEASPIELGQLFKKILARLGQLADKLASCLSHGAEFTVQDFEDLLRQNYELLKLKEHYSALKDTDPEAAKKYAEIEQTLQGTSALIDSFAAGFKKFPEYDRLKDCISQFGASELGILNKHANEVYRGIEALRAELNKLAAHGPSDQETLRQLKLKEEELRLHEEALQDCLNKKFIIENLGSISKPASDNNYGLIAAGAIAGGYLVNKFLKKGQGQYPYGITQEEIDMANAMRAFAQAHAGSGFMACSIDPSIIFTAAPEALETIYAVCSTVVVGFIGKIIDDHIRGRPAPLKCDLPQNTADTSAQAPTSQRERIVDQSNNALAMMQGTPEEVNQAFTYLYSLKDKKSPSGLKHLPDFYKPNCNNFNHEEVLKWLDPKNKAEKEFTEKYAREEARRWNERIAQQKNCSVADLKGTIYDVVAVLEDCIDRIDACAPGPHIPKQKHVQIMPSGDVRIVVPTCGKDGIVNLTGASHKADITTEIPKKAPVAQQPEKEGTETKPDQGSGVNEGTQEEGKTEGKKRSVKTPEDLVKDEKTRPGEKTNGPTTNHERPGGFKAAVEELKELGATDIKAYPDGKVSGVLPDGRRVVARPSSTYKETSTTPGWPTLEIQDGIDRTKFRFY